MAQSRKKRVLEQVERQRKQRTVISFTIVAVLIIIIVVAIIFLPRPLPNPVQLPPYLSHCVTGSLLYHSHPDLSVTIGGVLQTIPITFTASCAQPIHTHTSDGVLHVETDQDVNYTLGDWFILWGNFAANPTMTIFNSTQIFSNKAGPGTTHSLTMTVNGSPDSNPSDFRGGSTAAPQNLWLPRDAQTGPNNCSPVPATGCIAFNIVITYT